MTNRLNYHELSTDFKVPLKSKFNITFELSMPRKYYIHKKQTFLYYNYSRFSADALTTICLKVTGIKYSNCKWNKLCRHVVFIVLQKVLYNTIANKHAPIKKTKLYASGEAYGTLRNETKRYFAKWYFAKWYFAKWYFAKWYFVKWYFGRTGDVARYKHYRNKICTLIRLSRRRHYDTFFENNMANTKKTWVGINELLHRREKNLKAISALKDFKNRNKIVKDGSRIPNIISEHFATVGNRLATTCISCPFPKYII